jgi:putative ABC transport system permease protein
VTPQNGADLLELIRKFPSVTVIDIDAILGQIRRVMDQAATAVQYVFLFSLAAGVLVLLAVVDAGRDERLYESALLRSLGARRSQVLSAALIEFSLLGVLAGTLAAGGALVTGTVIADRVFQLDFDGNPWLWLAGLMAGLVLVGGSGFLATRTVVTHSPVAVLRRF